jgi:lysozyme
MNWYQVAKYSSFFNKYKYPLSIIAIALGLNFSTLIDKIKNNPNIISKVEQIIETGKIYDLTDNLMNNEQIPEIKEIKEEIEQPQPDTEINLAQQKPLGLDKNQIYEMIKRHEGFRSFRYYDTEGVPTIGYGFNLNDPYIKSLLGEKYKSYLNKREGMSQDEAERIMRIYINKISLSEIYSFLPDFDSHPSEVKSILIDMHYNLGLSKLNNFKDFRAALLKKDYAKAADEMVDSKWYDQVGNRSKELVTMMRQASI